MRPIIVSKNARSVTLLALALMLILAQAGCQPAAQESVVIQTLATPASSPAAAAAPALEPSAAPTLHPTVSASATSTLHPTVTASATPFQPESFSFALTADMRYFTGPGDYNRASFFRGAAQSIANLGSTSFMITAGDIDLPWNTRWTLDEVFGSSYLWYPVVGNHEHLPDSMNYLRAYNYDANGELPPNLVRQGPESCPQTMYSFDYLNAHFAVLNEYCTKDNDMSGAADVHDVVYNWLEEDLRAARQPVIFVIGHEPAFPQPDALTGRLRHENISLDKYPEYRDRFWDLMKAYDVTAYLCGHTHNYSAVQIDGLWQIDAGHARGIGDNEVPSTFVLIHVFQDAVVYETYRDDMQGGKYTLFESGALKSLH